MRKKRRISQCLFTAGGLCTLLVATATWLTSSGHQAKASPFSRFCCRCACYEGGPAEGVQFAGEPDGTWYWLRSPEEEKLVIMGLFNRYCIRCHGVDGRGVWDIPGVPNFTNVRWQESRSDAELARIILEGRGAVMPPFRGTLTLEESWAMGRYLRTFVPGTEVSRPDFSQPAKPSSTPPTQIPKKRQVPPR